MYRGVVFPLVFLTIEDDSQRTFMEQVYIAHRSSMYHTAMSVLRHPQDAEDVIQTVFLALCGIIPLLMEMNCSVLRSYIVISTRNAAIDAVRKRTRKPELLWGEEEYLDSLLDAPGEEQTALFTLIEQDALNRGTLRLRPRDRSLLEMKYILGRKDADIAKELGIKPDSVRSLLSRVKGRLLVILKEEQHEA